MPDRRLFAGDPLQAYVHQGDHHCAHKRSDHIEPCFSEIARRHAKNGYIPVDDEELDAIAIESNHTIEIDSFVPRARSPSEQLSRKVRSLTPLAPMPPKHSDDSENASRNQQEKQRRVFDPGNCRNAERHD
jgi:hypothetical protein